MARIPYREAPQDPWDWGRFYLHAPASPPWPDTYPSPPREPSGLLGPDGRPMPGPPPFPFGFRSARPR